MTVENDRIVVVADGELVLWWQNRLWADRKATREQVELNATGRLPVTLLWGAPPVEANLDDEKDLVAITAALMSAAPGRSYLVEAPAAVTDWFEKWDDVEGIH